MVLEKRSKGVWQKSGETKMVGTRCLSLRGGQRIEPRAWTHWAQTQINGKEGRHNRRCARSTPVSNFMGLKQAERASCVSTWKQPRGEDESLPGSHRGVEVQASLSAANTNFSPPNHSAFQGSRVRGKKYPLFPTPPCTWSS